MSDLLGRDPEDINYDLPEESMNDEEIEDLADAVKADVEPLHANAHDDE